MATVGIKGLTGTLLPETSISVNAAWRGVCLCVDTAAATHVQSTSSSSSSLVPEVVDLLNPVDDEAIAMAALSSMADCIGSPVTEQTADSELRVGSEHLDTVSQRIPSRYEQIGSEQMTTSSEQIGSRSSHLQIAIDLSSANVVASDGMTWNESVELLCRFAVCEWMALVTLNCRLCTSLLQYRWLAVTEKFVWFYVKTRAWIETVCAGIVYRHFFGRLEIIPPLLSGRLPYRYENH